MKKIMKYETPEIEFTRFEVDTRIMNVILPGGDDGDLVDIPTDSPELSLPDVEIPTT